MQISTPEEADLAIANLSDEEILNTPIEDFENYIQSKQQMIESSQRQGDLEDVEQSGIEESPADDKTAEEETQFGTVNVDGEEIPLNSMDDVMQLAKLGTKYSSLSEKFKPIRKIAKTLERSGLLSEDKINFMIDLMKGNPKAIGKLIKDNNLDPLTDFADNSEYKNIDYMISEKEMDVQDILDEIKGRDKYDETVNAISGMDQISKAKFYDNPDLIVVLNNQIKNGDYQKIVKETKRLKTLGYIPKADDFTNYFNVGKMLFEAGKLSDSPKSAQDSAKTKAKKSSAGNPRGKSASEQNVDMSKYYDMSDEEILNLDLNKIMR